MAIDQQLPNHPLQHLCGAAPKWAVHLGFAATALNIYADHYSGWANNEGFGNKFYRALPFDKLGAKEEQFKWICTIIYVFSVLCCFRGYVSKNVSIYFECTLDTVQWAGFLWAAVISFIHTMGMATFSANFIFLRILAVCYGYGAGHLFSMKNKQRARVALAINVFYCLWWGHFFPPVGDWTSFGLNTSYLWGFILCLARKGAAKGVTETRGRSRSRSSKRR